MSIHEAEKAAAGYLLDLDKDEREHAVSRINQLVRASTPPDEAAPTIPVSTLAEYLQREIETPPFIVSNGQVVRGEITATVARAGKGKTTLGMNRMVRWAAGRPLFDDLEESQVPTGPLRVLMIENEGVAAFMQEKLGLLARSAGLDEDQRKLVLENLMIWGDGGFSGLKVDSENDLDLIHRACQKHKPDIILMEPFRGIWTGDEQDSTAMEGVLDTLVSLAHENKVGILLTHHERKSGAGDDGEWMSASRGSTVLEAKCAVMESWRGVKNGVYRELTWTKSRFHPAQAPVRMLFDHAKWRYELVPADETQTLILETMQEDPEGWYWVNELAEELDEPSRAVRDALESLKDDNRVVRKKGTDERRGYRYRLRSAESPESGGLSIA